MKDFFEKTLEDIIVENKDTIHEKGFVCLFPKVFRQYVLPSKKKIDILSYDVMGDEIILYLIELKRDKTKSASLLQAYSYLDELLEILYETGYTKIYATIVLVGFENEFVPICKFLTCPAIFFSYKYGLNGLIFTQQRVIEPHVGKLYSEDGGIEISRTNNIDAVLNKIVNG